MAQHWGWQDRIPAGEGQGSEGGQDEYENCVYAAHALDMILLGYGDPFEPQQWRDGGVDPGTRGTHGGQSFQAAIDFIRAHPEKFPNPPAMTIDSPGDIVAEIDSYGRQGFPMVVAVYCDSQARINTSGPDEHAAVPVAQDDGGILLWADGFYGGTKYLPNATMRAAYAGGLTVFHRDCRPATPAEKPKPATTPTPPPPSEDNDMGPITIQPGKGANLPVRNDGGRHTMLHLIADSGDQPKAGAKVPVDLWFHKENQQAPVNQHLADIVADNSYWVDTAGYLGNQKGDVRVINEGAGPITVATTIERS